MAIANPINKNVRIRDYFYNDAVNPFFAFYTSDNSYYTSFGKQDIVSDSIKFEGTLMNGINCGSSKLTVALKHSDKLNKLLSYTGELLANFIITYSYESNESGEIVINPADQRIFTGYLSNKITTSVYDYGMPAVTITLESVGTKLLKKELYPDSLVDHYFSGYPAEFLNLISTQTDNKFQYNTNEVFNSSGRIIRVIKSGDTIEKLLKTFCLELGVVYYFNAYGTCVFYSIPTSAESSQTISNFALNGSNSAIEISRDIRKYKSARIQCDTYEDFTGEVFRINSGSDDKNSCNFEMQSGEHYPTLSDTGEPSAIECEDLEYGKDIVYMSSIGTPTLTSKGGNLQVNTFQLNGAKDILIDVENTSSTTATVTKFSANGTGVRVSGTDVYRTSIGALANESDNVYEVETEWIHTKTQCEYLARVLGSYFNYCDTSYTFYLEDERTYVETVLPTIPFSFSDNLVGKVVTLKDDTISGLNVTVLVTGVTYDFSNAYIKYKAVGYSKFNMDATVLESKRLNANVNRDGATGSAGKDGTDGKDGVDGKDGTNGKDGADGKTSYFHVKYSSVANPTTAEEITDTPSDYIGTYVDFTEADSTDPSKYKWTQFVGNRGIAGQNGENGKTSYVHIKYSNDGGVTFTDNNGETVGDYMGQYVDFNEIDSTEVTSYDWFKIKGETGKAGENGENGKTTYFHVKYSSVANPTTSSEMSNSPDKYIGTYVDFTEADSTEPTDYKWTQFKGNDGIAVDGKDGTDGKTSYFHIKYSEVENPTTSAEMTETPSKYIGTYVDFTEADSDDPTKYLWSQLEGDRGLPGENGENGKTQYLHIKYSNDGGNSFTSNNGEDVGDYMGQYVDFNEIDSTEVGSYKWVKIKGETGPKGDEGLEFGRITVNPTSFEYDVRNPKEVTIEYNVEVFGVDTGNIPQITATSSKTISATTQEGSSGYQQNKGTITLTSGATSTLISWSLSGTSYSGTAEVIGIDITEYNKYLGMVDNTTSVSVSPLEGDCIYSKETDCLYVYEEGNWVLFSSSAQSDEVKSNLAGQAQRDVLSRVETGSTLSSEYAYFLYLITKTVSTNALTMIDEGIIQSSNVSASTIDNDGYLNVDGYRLEGKTSNGSGVLRAKNAYVNDFNAKNCTITDATITGELTGKYINTVAPSASSSSFDIAEQQCVYENSEVRHYIVTSLGGSANSSKSVSISNIQGSVYGFSIDGYTLKVRNKQWGDPYGVEGYDFKYLTHTTREWYCQYYCQASDSNTGFISYAGQSASDRKTLFPDGTEVDASDESKRILVKKSDGSIIVDTMSSTNLIFVNVTSSMTSQFTALGRGVPYVCSGTVKGGGLTLSGTLTMTRSANATSFSQGSSVITIPDSGRMYGGNLYVSVTYQLAREGIETNNIYAMNSTASIGETSRYFKYGFIDTLNSNTIYGTMGNDLADCINISDDMEIESGYCYCFDGTNYYKSTEYMDKKLIGIHSDTASFYLGGGMNKKQLKIAVAGFVLAYVDKEYEVGTPLTCTENGYLTEIKQEDKVNYPERVIAVYWKNEPNETWGRVTVNGRKWVKIR